MAQHDEVTFVTASGNKYVGEPWRDDGVPVVGLVIYQAGNRYQGEVLGDIEAGECAPFGYGTLTTTGSNGGTIIYDGDFALGGVRSGHGRLRRYLRGVSSTLLYLYEGQFRNDLPSHGSGTETAWGAHDARMETRYTGAFLDGLRHGHGLLEELIKGIVIEGEFRDGKPHGHVIVKWTRNIAAANQQRSTGGGGGQMASAAFASAFKSYDGPFRNGEMHGEGGTLVSMNEVFKGQFRNGRRLNGVICNLDGSNARRARYDEETGTLLEFEDLEAGAHGVAIGHQQLLQEEDADATSASGAARSNADRSIPLLARGREGNDDPNAADDNSNNQQQHATTNFDLLSRGADATCARIEFSNGDVFVGDVVSGRAHGMGTLSFKGGAGGSIEGHFENNKPHGHGLLSIIDHDLYNDRHSAARAHCWRYEGNFHEGKFHGFGRWWAFNGDSYTGAFVRGRMTGHGRYQFGESAVAVAHALRRIPLATGENGGGDRVVGQTLDGEELVGRDRGAGAGAGGGGGGELDFAAFVDVAAGDAAAVTSRGHESASSPPSPAAGGGARAIATQQPRREEEQTAPSAAPPPIEAHPAPVDIMSSVASTTASSVPYYYDGEFLDSVPHGRGALWLGDRVIRGTFEKGCCNDEHATIEYFAVYDNFNEDETSQRQRQQQQQQNPQSQNYDDDGAAAVDQIARELVFADDNNNNDNDCQVAQQRQQQHSPQHDSERRGRREVVERYEGSVFHNKRHGLGEHWFEGGQQHYFGEFDCDAMHGVGIMSFPDGSNYEGRFVNNVPQGTCVIRRANRRVFRGCAQPFLGVSTNFTGMEDETAM